MSGAIFSMTGYATEQAATEDGIAFSLTLKSVNHRFLDLSLRLPNDCDGLDAALRRVIREHIKRGHVDITLSVDRRNRETAQSVHLNRELLATHLRLFHEAAKLCHFNVEPNLNELMRIPGVLSSEAAPAAAETSRTPALEAAVLALAPSLLARLNEVRAAEGAALAAELRASMLRLRALAEESVALRVGVREAHYARLRGRLAELLSADALSQTTESRLLAEAAMLVERSDIEEELVRLRAHVDSFLAMLDGGGELGKRLDFLLQELNREANTMLSKTTGAAAGSGLRLTGVGLEMKAEIEKAREQVQNLE